ncbi:MAG: hypothetical protein A2Z34_01405 [Planctomycetes bacterium RBG_16_59_8]|nr:MAG: hypothetical protein A2Z34_01405 [Planctomycetes bacterium RBG_16_59_8]
MNIVLIGFRCAGKTTVGKKLAKRIGMRFLDCDDYIETRARRSIKTIFGEKGESHFRLLESNAIAEISKLDGRVIATGGGAVLRYKNIRNLKRNGFVICLEVDTASASERIKNDPDTDRHRPKLTDHDLNTEINEQLVFRREYYEKATDFAVRTTGRTIDEVVEEIVAILRERGIETETREEEDHDGSPS